MKMIRIAICDDEEPMHGILKKQLERYAKQRNIRILYSDYADGDELLLDPYEHDLIFLDFQMKVMDGLETAKRLRAAHIDTPVIFLTSFPHIVFESFSVQTFRFLVKPINPEKLDAALDDYLSGNDADKYMIFKDGEVIRRISIDDIIYAEASDKYCYIRTSTESYLYKKTLADLESALPKDRFFRSHRTYLVGFRHIVSHTETTITLDNNEKALLSKMKRTPFKKAFQDYIKRYHFGGRA